MGAIVRSGSRPTVQLVPQEKLATGQQYLTFFVSTESFAIPIAIIREIIEYRAPTDMPMMPPFIRGVINLRGRVVPVIDLAVRMGREKESVTRRTCIVILDVIHDGLEQEMGVVVDAVSAVVDIADNDIEPPPSFGAKLRADFISGMGKIEEKFIIILSINHVISIDELAALVSRDSAQVSSNALLGRGDSPA
jgi:purine-binding chemotaxis protein CheW